MDKEMTEELQYIVIRQNMFNQQQMAMDKKFARKSDVKIVQSILKKLSDDLYYSDEERNEFSGDLTRREKKYLADQIKNRIILLKTKVIPEYETLLSKEPNQDMINKIRKAIIKADDRSVRLGKLLVEVENGL